MHVILLALGAIGAAVGAALIALHPPIDFASLANLLIVVGAIAIAAGAVLAGLSVSNRELRRIAAALDPPSRTGAALPELPRLDDAPGRLEPTLQAAPAGTPSAVINAETPRAEPLLVAERAADLDLHPLSGGSGTSDPPPEELVVPRPDPQPPAQKSAFDSVWSTQPRDGREAPEVAPFRGETATVFKSGVIDGMAYTLYTDGSIEAELPQGLVRFASIEELRNYLEKAGGEHR